MIASRLLTAIFAAASVLAGCSATPDTMNEREQLDRSVHATILLFQETDPGLKTHFENAHGYAVFPTIGKGGVGVGGAYGRGEVFEKGGMIGYCDLTQGTIGLQLGGQSYSEVIFFRNTIALETFKDGKLAFAAQASAVAASAGASADADYENGVMVFTMSQGGLMGEASIGGQSFSFEPK